MMYCPTSLLTSPIFLTTAPTLPEVIARYDADIAEYSANGALFVAIKDVTKAVIKALCMICGATFFSNLVGNKACVYRFLSVGEKVKHIEATEIHDLQT